MDSLKELRKLVLDTKVDSNTYVYFNQESGKIEKVGSKSDEKGLSYITVDYKVVEPIMKGEKGLNDYVVEYSVSKKKLSITEIKKLDTEDERSLLTFQEVLTTQKTNKVDILVQQDKIKKEWNIKISDSLKESLQKESVYIRSNLFFSITKKGDPNILYRTISCPVGELINDKNKNGISFPFQGTNESNNSFSIFTSKYFDVYKYEVIE